PLAETLPHLVRLSSLIAHELRRQLEPAGATEVQLTGAAGPAITEDGLGSLSDTPWLPLVDWRARTVPPLPDDVFQLSGANPGCRGTPRVARGGKNRWQRTRVGCRTDPG